MVELQYQETGQNQHRARKRNSRRILFRNQFLISDWRAGQSSSPQSCPLYRTRRVPSARAQEARLPLGALPAPKRRPMAAPRAANGVTMTNSTTRAKAPTINQPENHARI